VTLQELREKSGASNAEIAKELDTSIATVSGAINDTLSSNKKALYQAEIRTYLEAIISERRGFITADQQMALNFLEAFHKKDKATSLMIVGDSGIGKSTVVKNMFSEKHDDVLYFKMRRNLTVSRMMSKLLGTVSSSDYGTTDQKFDRFVKGLRTKNIKTIIIDEADLIVKDSHETFNRKFEIFRELYENGFHVIIVGLQVLEEAFRELTEDYVQRRMGKFLRLGITIEEMKIFWEKELGFALNDEANDIINGCIDAGYLGTLKELHENYQITNDFKIANNLVFNLRREKS